MTSPKEQGRTQGLNKWHLWFQNGFCSILYSQKTNPGFILQNVITLGSSRGAGCIVGMCYFLLWCCEAKHIEYYNGDSSIAGGNVILFAAEYHLRTVQAAPYNAMVSVLVLGAPHVILLLYISYLFAKKAGITQCLKRKVQKSEKKCAKYQRQKSV